ncbi:NAD(P)/FAD-dependent oxidoreductase [Nioella nitratireducens]|uniref:NAD(P)/FAD-dependent oxidoreductase n=1 Tax=Nioella nitratireducens TaxID=1287720 RepID=UPI0008FD710B|nr:FAD-binding oxidoreductase [Nioella nitratireducens]
MIPNDRPVIADSLWTATATPAPVFPPLTGEAEADLAIVGGGFTGLSAALHAAEAGLRVVLLEAEQPGWGASGRNGGQVNPGLHVDPDDAEDRFGREVGARMVAFAGGAGRLVFDLIERHGIPCDPRPVGWIRAAHSPATLRDLQGKADQWAAREQPVRMLSRDETAAMIGTTAYRGGLIDLRGGNLHPLNYATGLAVAADKAGAVIHGNSRATALTMTDGHHVVHTRTGTVRAGKLVLATNGYTDGLIPGLAKTVVPVRSVQVATDPLPDDIAQTILPGGQAPSDLRRLLLYFRKDAAGRFVMGGRGAYGDRATAARLAALRKASVQMFPQLAPFGWRHAWGGFVAVTPDHYPKVIRVAPGALAALGYNGRGVALATAMGKMLADWGTGTAEADLPFPVTEAQPIPFHRFRKLGVAATVTTYRMMDALGL